MNEAVILLDSAPAMAPAVAILGIAALGSLLLRRFRTRTRVVLGLFGIVMLYTAAHAATWSVRLDSEGVEVSAPLSLAGSGASIRWSEVTGIELREEGLRRPKSVLALRDARGEEVEITVSLLQREDVAPLVELVLQRSDVSEAQKSQVRAGVANAEYRSADIFPLEVTRTAG